ncbi:hypothetical protein GURASL_08780 [Geotalea uraniireducens]|uniref:Uncharacterized protein n=1 Tax=Geotalea uraniireducens TaxID=351604 RepID=A0ABM8EHP2_9BACT|nr:hypothetical protein [Geotalea uraniireducens]BDV41955.1 hypothetical protein GURASL_08780 [Geotalea uraniireducens]
MMITDEKPSFLRILGFSVVLGVLIGVLCIWLFSPFEFFFASVGAGVAFAVTFGIASTFTKLSRKAHFLPVVVVAGFVGGCAWWAIAKPNVPIYVSVLIGGGFAAVAMWNESDLVFGRKRKP